MARIDWLVACDLAFVDRQDRLCLIGVVRHLPVPELPLEVHQLMLVARVADLGRVDEVDVGVAVRNPDGLLSVPTRGAGVVVDMAGDYILITLRSLPILDEGVYQFQVALGSQAPRTIEIPVFGIGPCIEPRQTVN